MVCLVVVGRNASKLLRVFRPHYEAAPCAKGLPLNLVNVIGIIEHEFAGFHTMLPVDNVEITTLNFLESLWLLGVGHRHDVDCLLCALVRNVEEVVDHVLDNVILL